MDLRHFELKFHEIRVRNKCFFYIKSLVYIQSIDSTSFKAGFQFVTSIKVKSFLRFN